MDEADVAVTGLEAELPGRFEEGQGLYVAGDAADFAEDDVRRGLVAMWFSG